MVGTYIAFDQAVFPGNSSSWVGNVEIAIGTLTFLMCGRWLRRAPVRTLEIVGLVLCVLPIVAALRVGPLLLLTLPATLLWPVAAAVLESEDSGPSPALEAPPRPLRMNQRPPG